MTAGVDPVEVMNGLHVDIGRKAAELALAVLEALQPADIPVASAVALLKFGVDLERKALLGAEDDAVVDPFAALATALTDPPAGDEPVKKKTATKKTKKTEDG